MRSTRKKIVKLQISGSYCTVEPKLFVLVILIEIVKARMSIVVHVNQENNITISYSGSETNILTDDDIKSFQIEDHNLLKEAVKMEVGKRPDEIYLKGPSPDSVYEYNALDDIEKVLTIKSARVKTFTKKPVVVLTQDFDNVSHRSIKVNTGISHTIQNTLTTSWSKQNEIKVSQNIQFDFNAFFVNLGGRTDFSFATNWGNSEEKTNTETIGAQSGLEVTLESGQGVKAVLSSSAGYMEIEVEYKASLTGSVLASYDIPHDGAGLWDIDIEKVMERAGISNEITTTEIIKFGFHVDASLKVYDKATGMLI